MQIGLIKEIKNNENRVALTPAGATLIYRPALFARARLHFARASFNVDAWREFALLATLHDGAARDPWKGAALLAPSALAVDTVAEPGARFDALPPDAAQKTSYTAWGKALKSFLYRARAMTLYSCSDPRCKSEPDETERDFRVRLVQLAREQRDMEIEKLRSSYGPKLARLEERIRKAQQKIEREQSQYSEQRTSTVLSVGSTLLGALFGRKTMSVGNVGRATTTARRASKLGKEKADIRRAVEDQRELQQELADLESEFQGKLADLRATIDAQAFDLTETILRPRKSDLDIPLLALAWSPWSVSPTGIAEPLFTA